MHYMFFHAECFIIKRFSLHQSCDGKFNSEYIEKFDQIYSC